nr:MAG TPA: hypothetical protein [Caudoviricetes sp.]
MANFWYSFPVICHSPVRNTFLFLKNFWKFSCDSQRESELL